MVDIMVDSNRDLAVTYDGDIKLCENSISQDIMTRLLWIKGEWRLGPDLGFPWYEDMLVKNPNKEVIMADIRDAIMDVEGVTSCTTEFISFDRRAREIRFRYSATCGNDNISEEVALNV